MTERHTQSKPDDRSDNVDKLQNMVQNTLENMEEAEETMEFSSGDARQQIKAKNQRRKESIETMREEIEDEANDQKFS